MPKAACYDASFYVELLKLDVHMVCTFLRVCGVFWPVYWFMIS